MNGPMQIPHETRLASVEAEQFVLGGLLIDNDAIDRIGDLRAEHFWNGTNRQIFVAILRLVLANKPADVLTVFDALQAAGSDAADIAYLNAMQQSTPSAANIGRHAAIVRDRAIKRGLVEISKETAERAEVSGEDASTLIDKLTSKLESLAEATVKCDPALVADELPKYVESIDERYNGNGIKAIPTGFDDLDKKLNGGLHRGGLYVLAARPKMGKTALALNIGVNCATDYSVLVCSMEMPKSQLHDRNVANLGQIHLDHLLDPRKMTDSDWPRLTNAVMKLKEMHLYQDDQPALTLMHVRTKAKQVKRKAGLDVMIIDYLQLMEGDGPNRNAQIESITRGLKNLAKELGIAIILLSQLNRKLEDRPNKRPQPSDLRDSGSIEQDADVAIFLYRDEVYNPDSNDKGICEVDVALNRQGAAGRVALAYIGEQTRFENLARSWHPPLPKTPARQPRGFQE